MSKYKILFKITGSIAAYKSASLISKLVQNNCEVKVAATSSALNFIGIATLEGLTGNRVLTDAFEEGTLMSHIDLNKWADLTIVCPASANTINKFAAGIADTLVTSLFLARDAHKPYLIVPAMNTAMYEHPATQQSLAKLEFWGAEVLPTSEGYLACGDTGKGKMLELDIVYEYILQALKKETTFKEKKLEVMITSGGTKENIDGVRFLANLSTGKTGAAIAEYFVRVGHNVTFLYADNSSEPKVQTKNQKYIAYDDLKENLFAMCEKKTFDAVIHLAAVADYSPYQIETGTEVSSLPLKHKLDSTSDEITLRFRRNEKLITQIKKKSQNKNVFLAGFKLTNTPNADERKKAVDKLFLEAGCDVVISNDINDRDDENRQTNFSVFSPVERIAECKSVQLLAQEIEKQILEKRKVPSYDALS